MHSSCDDGDCYGRLFRKLTSFDLTRELLCDLCPYVSQDSQKQCVLRVEPAADASAYLPL